MEHIFFGNVLNLNELCLLELEVSLDMASHTNLQAVQSEHSLKVIRCRELIFTEPDIIGSPDLDDSRIYIIMQQSLFRTGRIQGRFNRMGIQCQNPRRVLPIDFQTCLNYTMVAKLAPAWNKLGKYLVQGRDFVSQEGKLNAVEYDLHIGCSEIYISLKAALIRSPPVKLDHIGVAGSIAKEFFANYPDGKIEEYSIFNQWCHVLPSLKMGQVINVLHQLPPDGAIHTYRDMKKHWKNNYGYRLPETDDGLLYYLIYFKPLGDILFTYPDVCIRPGNAQTFPRVDPAPILSDFLEDLASRVPSVCGRTLKFAKQPQFAEAELMESSRTPEDNPNLTAEMPGSQFPHYRHYAESRTGKEHCESPTRNHVIADSILSSKFREGRNGHTSPPAPNGSQLSMEKFVPRFGRMQTLQSSQHRLSQPISSQNLIASNSVPVVPRFGPLSKPIPMRNRNTVVKRSLEVPVCNDYHSELERIPQYLAGAPAQRVPHPASTQQASKDTETLKLKKPRTKPQVQKDMDLEDLARSNQLCKANSATLIAWLKSKGIPYKNADKKSELLNKVLLAVNLSRSATFDY